MSERPARVLFVCLGNICRSPTAEAVLAKLAEERGLGERIEVDSAGTGSWHVGEPPDPRARAAAAERGVTVSGQARQIEPADFKRFDVLVAMDRSVQRTLERLAPDPQARSKVRLLPGEVEVPDPYYGPDHGFERVLDLLEKGCAELLAELTDGSGDNGRR